MRAPVLVLLLLLLRPQQQPEMPKEALESIKADEAFEHVKVLASDAYEGREAGTAGNNKAAAYIAGFLKKWGLKPAGPAGYFQPFDADGKTQNVLARIEGADSKLKKEYVVLGAHYDHVGSSGDSVNGDHIYNGADDNASGTSVLLEIAQALALLKKKPARSLLFAWWSAEEKGLLGSKHFIKNPTVDLRSIVAYINMDMVGRNGADQIEIEGTGCSPDLKTLFDKVNEAKIFANLDYSTSEVKPETDHYSFYEAGIPTAGFFGGYHEDMHKPSDEADKIDKQKLQNTGRFVALSAWALAHAAKRPAFQKNP